VLSKKDNSVSRFRVIFIKNELLKTVFVHNVIAMIVRFTTFVH